MFEYFKHSHWTTFKPLDGWIRRRLRSILRGYSKGKGSAGVEAMSAGQTNTFRTLGILAFTMPIVLCFSPHEVNH